MNKPFKSPYTLFITVVFIAALIWQASEIFRGWDHNILPHHGFRQTQTAISAFYFIKDGFSLYTTIPVFGPPWIIPIEFPLYQWILAGTVKLTDLPIDQTGRGISLVFHYISLFLAFRILRQFRTSLAGSLFILTLITLSPLATYWAQGVLIESFSLALTLAYIAFFLKAAETNGKFVFFGTCLFGVLSALVKVTTFAIGWGFLVLYALYKLYEHRHQLSTELIKSGLHRTLPYVLPLMCAAAWIHHANSIMDTLLIEPIAMSNFQWFFGNPGARFEPDQSMQVFKHTMIYALGSPFPLLLALLPLCLRGVDRIKIALFFAAAISGPLVFWNVYYVHDYYSYEILFFLCISIGLCFEGGLRVAISWMRPAIIVLQLIILTSILVGYSFTPYPWLFRNDYKADEKQFYEDVSTRVAEEDFLLVAGLDWDPSAAYSTQRKTLMIRWNSWINSDKFMKAFHDTLENGYNCGGVIIQANNVPEPMRRKILDKFGMEPTPLISLNDSLLFFEALKPPSSD